MSNWIRIVVGSGARKFKLDINWVIILETAIQTFQVEFEGLKIINDTFLGQDLKYLISFHFLFEICYGL